MKNRRSFNGYQPLWANYLHLPNQFYDLCLRFGDRGEIRLVAHFVHEAYRLIDRQGNPNLGFLAITHSDLKAASNISTGAFDRVLDSCIRKNFIEGTRHRGRGEYRIKCSENPTTKLSEFVGFFNGRGHWTPTPEEFLTYVIPNYRLAEIKIAGTVLRFTNGYEEKLGLRRQQHPLSISYLTKYTGISDRKTLTDAIAHLEADNIIECIERGRIHPDCSEQKTSVYSPKWDVRRNADKVGYSKSQPETDFQKPNQVAFSKLPPEDSKSQPEKIFKNPTNRKTVPLEKDNHKQSDVVVDLKNLITLLRDQGVAKSQAQRLVVEYSAEHIENQVGWLPFRNASNPPALLVRAIEHDFSKPSEIEMHEQAEQVGLRAEKRKQAETEQQQALVAAKTAAQEAKQFKHQQMLEQWRTVSLDYKRRYFDSAEKAGNEFTRRRLRKNRNYTHPPLEVLQAMMADQQILAHAA